jgi:hypothetical protein
LPLAISLMAPPLPTLTARRRRRRIATSALLSTTLRLASRLMKRRTELPELLAQSGSALLAANRAATLRAARVTGDIMRFTAPFVTRRAARASVLCTMFTACTTFTTGLWRLFSSRRALPSTRISRRIGSRVLRGAAPGVAGVRLLAGRRRFLVRPSGAFGYVRHGGAL